MQCLKKHSQVVILANRCPYVNTFSLFCMNVKKLTLDDSAYPNSLMELAQPPKQLFVQSDNWDDLMGRPRVAIIGSRKVSAYGRQVTTKLAGELAAQGIVIVCGLALGVDGLAHQAALDAGGLTIAVLPTSLHKIYPASHQNLARNIVQQGGALMTEYEDGADVYKTNFVARNRIVAGISAAVLITEAALKSGSLHTARFALEQGIDVLAVPGNITSPTSEGTNNLIKSGATPITCADDVLHALGLRPQKLSDKKILSADPHEQTLLELLQQGTRDGTELLTTSQLEVGVFNQTLTMLEITGKIRSLGANQWTLS
jgi:DNA processing protein